MQTYKTILLSISIVINSMPLKCLWILQILYSIREKATNGVKLPNFSRECISTGKIINWFRASRNGNIISSLARTQVGHSKIGAFALPEQSSGVIGKGLKIQHKPLFFKIFFDSIFQLIFFSDKRDNKLSVFSFASDRSTKPSEIHESLVNLYQKVVSWIIPPNFMSKIDIRMISRVRESWAKRFLQVLKIFLNSPCFPVYVPGKCERKASKPHSCPWQNIFLKINLYMALNWI